MNEKLSAAQQRMRDLMKNQDLAKIVGGTFAEVLVESMDAKKEADHWKRAFEQCRNELRVMVAVLMKRHGNARLVVTRAELKEFEGQNVELWRGDPEDGVRIYELRPKAVQEAVKNAIGTGLN